MSVYFSGFSAVQRGFGAREPDGVFFSTPGMLLQNSKSGERRKLRRNLEKRRICAMSDVLRRRRLLCPV